MLHHSFLRSMGYAILVGLCQLPGGSVYGEAVTLPKGVVFSKPLMPDNIVADMRAFNEELSRNVKPEENAVVWLLQALGTECVGDAYLESTLDMLGVQSFSKEGPELEKLEAFGRRREKAGKNYAKESFEFNEGMRLGPTRLWKRSEFGAFADYLDESSAAFDLVTTGVRQPAYYWPLVSEEVPQHIISASHGLELRLVFLAKLLSARANLRVAEGEIDLALTDILTLHRLASLMSHGLPLEVTVAKAQMIDALAYGSEMVLFESGKLTSETATRYSEQLAAVPLIASAAEAADRGERFVIRQEIALLRLNSDELKQMFIDPSKEEEPVAPGKPKPPKPIPKIDWKLAVQRGDEIQDQVKEVLSEPLPSRREELFAALDRDYQEWDTNNEEITKKMLANLEEKNDLAGASRYLGETMARAMKTHYRQRLIAEQRTRSRRDSVMVALALVSLIRDKGEFPASLEELSPGYLKEIPLDANTGKPFDYVKEAKESAVLTSWGSNGQNDAGKVPNDDQIIRLR